MPLAGVELKKALMVVKAPLMVKALTTARAPMVMKALTAVMLMGLLIGACVLSVPSGGEAQRGARAGQPAPEITGGPWINSQPLSLEKLRGRVVLVEFWTYG